jgi:hypothetical protein
VSEIEDIDDKLVSPMDAQTIGFKVVEMADRLHAISPAVPGVQAEWNFVIDDIKYKVVVSEVVPR